MSRFFASLSALHWGLLALSFAMLTYALLPTAAPEGESHPLHSSPQSSAIAVSEKDSVQPLPQYTQIKAEQESGQADLPHGPLLNEQKTGTGNIKWPDKRFYKGSIVAGIPHGKGHMLFPDGRRYFGQFSNGTMHGEAKFIGLTEASIRGNS